MYFDQDCSSISYKNDLIKRGTASQEELQETGLLNINYSFQTRLLHLKRFGEKVCDLFLGTPDKLKKTFSHFPRILSLDFSEILNSLKNFRIFVLVQRKIVHECLQRSIKHKPLTLLVYSLEI